MMNFRLDKLKIFLIRLPMVRFERRLPQPTTQRATPFRVFGWSDSAGFDCIIKSRQSLNKKEVA